MRIFICHFQEQHQWHLREQERHQQQVERVSFYQQQHHHLVVLLADAVPRQD
jgi:hypothetical protein